ncbi:MAG: YjbF family lipoprotein [Pseudomonadota bacterium]
MTVRRSLCLASGASALLLVTACGNDPERESDFALAQSTLSSALGPALSRGAGAPPQAASTPEALAAVLPQFPPGPVLRFEVPEIEQSALAFQSARNGDYVTFATVTAQTLTTRGGIVTSTRGFGWDLMSSATNGAADLVRRRSAGTVDRIYRHLSAMDDEVETVASCRIIRDSSETITVASGTRIATTRIREACTAGELSFTNLYWVTSSGTIFRSRQWVSPEVGSLEIEIVRN